MRIKIRKSKRKIVILVLTAFVLLASSFIIYRLVKNKVGADITTTPTVDNSLQARTVYAKALNKMAYDLNFDPLKRYQDSLISPEGPMVSWRLAGCIEDYFNKTNLSQDQISCNIVVLNSVDGALLIDYEVDILYKFYAILREGSYPSLYNKDTVKVDLLEKKDGYASVESRYKLDVSCDKEKKTCFTGQVIDSPENYTKGDFSISNSISIGSDEKLLEPSSLSKFASSDYEIDPSLSYWNFSNTGKLNSSAEGNWDTRLNPKSKIINAKFCDQGCEIASQETMKIVANKKGLTDGIKGSIITFQDHKEKVFGKGTVDADGHQHWLPNDQGMKVIKDDARSWTQNLSYNGNPVKYSGGSTSHAEIYPIQNKSTITTTNNYKNFSAVFTTQSFPFFPWRPRTSTVDHYDAAINIKKQISQNDTLTKMIGDGSYSTYTEGSSQQASYFKGVFDVNAPSMRVTEGNLYPIGAVKSPFSMPTVEQYAQSYLSRESLKVPGYFTAVSGDATETIMSSRPVKTIPKKISVMRSYLKYDKAFTTEAVVPVDNFINEMKNKGAEVTEYDTTSKDKMLNAFVLTSSGSWVINMGHGFPTGLTAGNDFVKYSEIDRVLKDKAIKIDVLAAESCFAGHASIAETVIGSISVGFGMDRSIAGSLYGVGSQAWNYSAVDLVKALRKLIGSSCSD